VRPKLHNCTTQQNQFVLSLLAAGVEIMSSIIKTVSLDENSAKIAKELPNFSHFVRECLYRYASNLSVGECTREKLEKFKGNCNPFTQPVCFACWPNGAPPMESVKQFAQDNLSINWLQEQAKFANRDMIDLTNVNTTTRKSKKRPSKVGFFAQIRAKYRNKLK
tara:strand:- start:262 stop:753 length:492 start_codon:yes stop_codon:yes gene_type:complete